MRPEIIEVEEEGVFKTMESHHAAEYVNRLLTKAFAQIYERVMLRDCPFDSCGLTLERPGHKFVMFNGMPTASNMYRLNYAITLYEKALDNNHRAPVYDMPWANGRWFEVSWLIACGVTALDETECALMLGDDWLWFLSSLVLNGEETIRSAVSGLGLELPYTC